MRIRARLVAYALLATLLEVACAPDVSPRRADLLLVTFDTLRADHTSAYGYERATTPTLEGLAAGGVRFEVAYAPTATTAPSHATLFTSLSPLAHGVRRNGDRLGDVHVTLAERLSKRGYRTAAFVSSAVLAGGGFDQGFDVYDRAPLARGRDRIGGLHGSVPRTRVGRRASDTTDAALAWVRSVGERRDDPVFVWVHYFDPHEPFVPPASTGDPFDARHLPARSLEQAIALYDAEIFYADRELARLVRGMEKASRPEGLLVIVTADHGEEFMEHGWRSHGVHLYEELLRVPFIVQGRGWLQAGKVVEEVVGLQDVVPTVLGLVVDEELRADGVGGIEGEDLSATLLGSSLPPSDRHLPLIRRTYRNRGRLQPRPLEELGGRTFGLPIPIRGHQYGIASRRWKYLEAPDQDPAEELYDLAADPGETRNLATTRSDVAKRFADLVADWRAAHPAETPALPLPPETREMLEELGYAEPVQAE